MIEMQPSARDALLSPEETKGESKKEHMPHRPSEDMGGQSSFVEITENAKLLEPHQPVIVQEKIAQLMKKRSLGREFQLNDAEKADYEDFRLY